MSKEFTYRLDYYWKAISLYAVALIVYGLVRGIQEGVSNGKIEVVLYDPLLLLLFAFVAGSALTLLVNWYMRRSIVIESTTITFKNRIRSRAIQLENISRINIGREKLIKVRGAFKVVKIRLKSRRRLLRIRTSSFHNEHELVQLLIEMKKKIKN